MAGSFIGLKASKKLSAPENTSSTPVPPACTRSAAVTPLRAGMPPKSNAFSMCSVSRCQEAMPERLLRGVGQQPAHLLRIEAGAAAGRRGRAEGAGDARACCEWLSDHVLLAAKRRRDTRSDVVAERDRAQEAGAVDAESFAGGQRRRHDGGAGMRQRRRMRVVGLVRMGEHAVDERGFDGTADEVGGRRRSRPARPCRARAKLIANLPGGSSAPEIIAASVSRMCCLVFSSTSAGSVWAAAAAM